MVQRCRGNCFTRPKHIFFEIAVFVLCIVLSTTLLVVCGHFETLFKEILSEGFRNVAKLVNILRTALNALTSALRRALLSALHIGEEQNSPVEVPGIIDEAIALQIVPKLFIVSRQIVAAIMKLICHRVSRIGYIQIE